MGVPRRERRTQATLIRWSEAELAAIDRVRGGKDRTVWVRELCAAAVAAHDGLAVVAAERFVAPVEQRYVPPERALRAVASSSDAKAGVRPLPKLPGRR